MTDKQTIKHKVCGFQIYLSDDEGFIDGYFCKNIKETGIFDCPFFPSETYNCTYYVEGDEYDYC